MKRLITVFCGLAAFVIFFLLSTDLRNNPGHQAYSNDPFASTFSIAGIDPVTGDVGVAVQSKFPNVRPIVPWAEAGVGAIATQSFINVSYGPKGLALLRNGATAEEAVRILIANDTRGTFASSGLLTPKVTRPVGQGKNVSIGLEVSQGQTAEEKEWLLPARDSRLRAIPL